MRSRVYFNSFRKANGFATKTKSVVEILADTKKGRERSKKHNNAKFAVIPQTPKKEMWQITNNDYCDFGEGYLGKQSERNDFI